MVLPDNVKSIQNSMEFSKMPAFIIGFNSSSSGFPACPLPLHTRQKGFGKCRCTPAVHM